MSNYLAQLHFALTLARMSGFEKLAARFEEMIMTEMKGSL